MAKVNKAVAKQVREAEKLHAQIYPKDEHGNPIEPTSAESTNENIGMGTPEEVKKDDVQASDGLDLKTEAPKESEKVEDPKITDNIQDKKSDDWETKYNVLSGKYSAEMPRMAQTIRELKDEIKELKSNASVPAEKPEPTKTKQTKPEELFTPEEIEEFGPDLINIITRATSNAQPTNDSEIVEKLRAEIDTLKTSVNGINEKSSQNARDRLLSDLTNAVPNWEEQNSDPNFVGWLSQQDPYAGLLRHEMLDAAFERNDSARVINFFQGYLEENGVMQQTEETTNDEDSTSQAHVDLADYTAPAKSRGKIQEPAQKGKKRTWSQPQIAKFYSDIRKGLYKNKAKERTAIEKDIIAATQEGRLVA